MLPDATQILLRTVKRGIHVADPKLRTTRATARMSDEHREFKGMMSLAEELLSIPGLFEKRHSPLSDPQMLRARNRVSSDELWPGCPAVRPTARKKPRHTHDSIDPAPVAPTVVDPAPVAPTVVDPAPIAPTVVDPAPILETRIEEAIAPTAVDPALIAEAPVVQAFVTSPLDSAPDLALLEELDNFPVNLDWMDNDPVKDAVSNDAYDASDEDVGVGQAGSPAFSAYATTFPAGFLHGRRLDTPSMPKRT